MTALSPARVRACSAVGIRVVEELAPAGLDPLDFLERSVDHGDAFYFERRSECLAVATTGRLAPGGDAAGAREAAGRGGDWIADGALGAPIRVGGFAFDRGRTPQGPWEGYPAVAWDVPGLALIQRDGTGRLVACATDDEGGDGRARARIDEAKARLARPRPAACVASSSAYRLEPVGSVEDWRAGVETTLADIERGRLVKAVLARSVRLRAETALDPWRVARRLRSAQPEATVFAVRRGTKTFLGATPERLVRLHGPRMETAAVAGTALAVAGGGDSDAAFLADAKERREHRIVVEELCRRLRPLVSELTVPAVPGVWASGSLRHLVTPITGRLHTGGELARVCAALHPSPAVAGLPRARAMEAVRARESLERGWYAGGVGWVDDDGGEVVVPLRAALVEGCDALLYAGAGIVSGSRWQAELEETRLKMRVMLDALVEV